MRFKLFVILAILTCSIYSVAYSHSGRTNSSGCHNVRATGGYHCHGGGSSSSSSSRSSSTSSENDRIIQIGGIILLVIICWAIIDTDSNCLSDTPHIPHNLDAASHYLNQLPMRIPINTPLVPRFNFTRQEDTEWKLQASYIFQF